MPRAGSTGGLKMKSYNHLAAAVSVLSFGLVSAAPVQAADLGGNCCADLEERIAELEATTARKGNRKVSLTVYGQVNESVLFWDDGTDSDATVVTNDNSRTRFGFKGDAKINTDLKAGYMLEIGVRGNNSKRFSQDDKFVPEESGLDVRHSRWYLSSKTFGTLSAGTTPTAMEGVTEINLAQSKDVGKYSDVEDSGLGLKLRGIDGNLSNVQWRRLIKHTGDQPGESERRQGIWWQSAEFQGFNVEAGWGADDHWDVGLRYKGEIGDFKVAAGFAYGESTDVDSESAFFECTGTDVDGREPAGCSQFGGSASIMHSPTGLYVNVAAGQHQDDNVLADSDLAGTGADDSTTFFAVEAGIEQKFNSLGKTTLFGQYYDLDGGASERLTVAGGDAVNSLGSNANVFSSGLQMYGGGIVQELSGAGINLYAYYRHYEGELSIADDGVVAKAKDFEDLDIVMTGAIIKF
jgi:predicted porin